MDTQTEHEVAALHDVRLSIFRQHTQLAQLMDELESHANGVIKGDDCARSLHGALVLLHGWFVHHLDYEEARLAPLLRAAPKDAAAAMRTSLGDHADQRARIDGLLHDRTVFTDARTHACPRGARLRPRHPRGHGGRGRRAALARLRRAEPFGRIRPPATPRGT